MLGGGILTLNLKEEATSSPTESLYFFPFRSFWKPWELYQFKKKWQNRRKAVMNELEILSLLAWSVKRKTNSEAVCLMVTGLALWKEGQSLATHNSPQIRGYSPWVCPLFNGDAPPVRGHFTPSLSVFFHNHNNMNKALPLRCFSEC